MPQCVAWKCHNKTGETTGKSFHRFPKDPKKRKVWVNALRRIGFQAGNNTRLCGDHFEEACFIHTGKTIRLKDDAVPTIFDFPRHLQKTVKHRKPPADRTAAVPHSPPSQGQTAARRSATHEPGTDHTPILHSPSSQSQTAASPLSARHEGADHTLLLRLRDSPRVGAEHSYSVISPLKLKKRLDEATDKLDEFRKKLKVARRKNLRLQKRVDSLKGIVDSLKSRAESDS